MSTYFVVFVAYENFCALRKLDIESSTRDSRFTFELQECK